MLENNPLELATLLFYKYTTLVSTVKVSPLPGFKEQTLTVLDSHPPLYTEYIFYGSAYYTTVFVVIALLFLSLLCR